MVSGNGGVVVNIFASHALPTSTRRDEPFVLFDHGSTDRGVRVIIFTTMGNEQLLLSPLSSCSKEHSEESKEDILFHIICLPELLGLLYFLLLSHWLMSRKSFTK